MPRILKSTGLIGFCLFFFCAGALAGPVLQFEPDKLDFGTLTQGEKRQKSVTVKNAGDAPLIISQIRPSCAECIVEKAEAQTIAPGESLSLPVTFEASGVPGPQSIYLTFHSNDAAEPLKRLDLQVAIAAKDAVPEMTVEPEQLSPGIVIGAKPGDWAIKISNTGAGPLRIEEVGCSPNLVLSEAAPEEIAGGQSATLRVKLKEPEPGVLRGYVTVLSNDPKKRVRTIPLRGYVASQEEISSLLKGILITPNHDKNGLLRAVDITNYCDIPVQIAGKPGAPASAPIGKGESFSVVPVEKELHLEIILPTGPADSSERREK